MLNVKRLRILLFVLVIVPMLTGLIFVQGARAAEPRPWLCRQIPVFSGGKAMTWRATQRGAGHWLMTFMHYDPAGGHDGFTVVATSEVNGASKSISSASAYFARAIAPLRK